jgi:hypothetical protein
MKKSAIPAALLLTLVGLSGCPIYDHDDSGCYDHADCAPGYWCDSDTGSCFTEDRVGCNEPSDCGENETCGRNATCTIGDCHFDSVGCLEGYVCSSDSGRWLCVREDAGAGGGGAGSAGGAPSGGGAPVNGGAPTADAGEPAESAGAPGAGGQPMSSAGAGGAG